MEHRKIVVGSLQSLNHEDSRTTTNFLGQRVKTARQRARLSQVELARKVGVSTTTIQNYESGQFPKGDHAVGLASALECSLDWLLAGVTPQSHQNAPGPNSQQCGVPILGLAKCGLQGWSKSTPLSIKASRPGDMHLPGIFCVMAIGNSMVPAGILQGQLCFCNPHDRYEKGDAIYVERMDNTASIKLFQGADEQHMTLQGWLDPDVNGHQAAYTEQARLDQIRRVATVIYVKRKL
ncbi:LexA family transcriptional regulator [Salidesulfovibrio onnuriiensis]|uniref:LexA family transcriptional regulator n=1 Tax=Salidesulfovibrio onnuriiensis TaxID=2583823 RepID=UPI001C9D52F1|nr:LexA family transcriptional regulator [Salidesulfovibrio onnuriiensis]